MRVGIVGDKNWGGARVATLHNALARLNPDTDRLVLSDARGAESLARTAADLLRIPYDLHRREDYPTPHARILAEIRDHLDVLWFFGFTPDFPHADGDVLTAIELAHRHKIRVFDGAELDRTCPARKKAS